MIKYVNADVLDSGMPIVHCVNAQRRMASGVAKAIKEKYPQVYEDYMNEPELKLGTVIVSWSGTKIRVFSLVGQQYYGYDGKKYVDYDALHNGFVEIQDICEAYEIEEISMPMIGAGLAGGDWQVIEAIIETVFDRIQVYVYKL